MKKTLWAAFLMLLILFAAPAIAETLNVTWRADNRAHTEIHTSTIDGEEYLFLPSAANPAKLTLNTNTEGTVTAEGDNDKTAIFHSGEAFDLAGLFQGEPENGRYPLILTAENGETKAITLMFSANIRALFLVSDDPVQQGRAWLEDCSLHQNSTTGSMALLRADGSLTYDGQLEQLRGRGNSTWITNIVINNVKYGVDKKPYQIKLSEKTDLLDTGNPKEANKKWILLADYYDATLLHNRISFDLARELGEESASNCQPVDLYYDGEYRGLYLLAEKVEVGAGRVEITDYDKILDKLNQKSGIALDSLPLKTSQNAFGVDFVSPDGVEDGGRTDLGGYLLEMDKGKFENEKAYFGLLNGVTFTVISPQYASAAMVSAVSERIQAVNQVLSGYGVSADTGETWEDCFDADSLISYFWVNEFSKNADVWSFSSTYLTLPELNGKIIMGPIWDSDRSFYKSVDEKGLPVSDATGLSQTERNWGYDLYCIPSFQTAAKEMFTEKLEPLIRNILLGNDDAHGKWLHSLNWYWQEESASRRMNDVLWDPISVFGSVVAPSYEENFQNLNEYIRARVDWLDAEVERWPQSASAAEIDVTLDAPYGNAEGRTTATVDDVHANATFGSVTTELKTEATAEAYAVYRSVITVNPKLNIQIARDVTVCVNGTPAPCVHNADGSVTVTVSFEDPSYRPAEYDGTDYGLVFNVDYYREHYPEIVAEVGDNPDDLLAYYVDYGIDEGQAANSFFDPAEVLRMMPDVLEMLGENYSDVVSFFIDAGYEDWMSALGKAFIPAVTAEEP